MINFHTVEEAKILIVGDGELVEQISKELRSEGIQDITRLPELTTEKVSENADYLDSFHVILVANQPRPVEVALSDLRWPKDGNADDPDLPMMVMRHTSNTVKMRCQYRELMVNGVNHRKWVSLPMELPPWTEEKRALLPSIIQTEFRLSQDAPLRAYFVAAMAMVTYQQIHNAWAVDGDQAEVEEMIRSPADTSRVEVIDFIAAFCKGGLASVQETTMIFAKLVVLDAVKLLTGKGEPVNHANLEEIIRIGFSLLE